MSAKATSRSSRVPEGPLCWRAARHTVQPGGAIPPSDFHAHPVSPLYQVSGVQFLELDWAAKSEADGRVKRSEDELSRIRR